MKVSYTLTFLLFASFSYAQFMDTLHRAFTGSKSFVFRWESRNSFIDNERMEVTSLKLGLTFGRKISLGGGYSWLSTKVNSNYYFKDQELVKDTFATQSLKFRYLCYYVDYLFYKSKRWSYSVPMQIGFGFAGNEYNYRGKINQVNRSFAVVYEPDINVKFKVIKWLGLGANVGYRIVLKNNKLLGKKFNSPLYSAGILIYWDELLLSFFPKNKLVNDTFGPSEW